MEGVVGAWVRATNLVERKRVIGWVYEEEAP